ncbi:MAG: holo-[acyl-carrier-protein] synthase [Caedibacter sp. 38-128]|nr:holo-ACP synthase [Holosporales bacterium]OJX04008.1 MAG: holo-[acyl-carrier-protein] synthase [Caedibacter sp. 38-128]
MIIGIGTDLVEIKRIEDLISRHKDRFMERVFTPVEIATALALSRPAASLAKRFAAKEAFVKALGTGFSQEILLTEVEVYNEATGQPRLRLYGAAQRILHHRLEGFQKEILHLSLSDTQTQALAFVVIEGQ